MSSPLGSCWPLWQNICNADHLYNALRKDIPFPVRNADALEVVRITEIVKQQNSQFDWVHALGNRV